MARRFRVSMRKGINVPRVVGKITVTVIALWVGGTIITEVGQVMLNTSSPFYKGLTLIGWTVSDNAYGTTSVCHANATNAGDLSNCITGINGSGVLAVVGIIGIASIVLEFVKFRM